MFQTDLFEGLNPINRKIKINNVEFTVVGVLASKGTSGFMSGDSNVLIPLDTGYAKVFGTRAKSNGKKHAFRHLDFCCGRGIHRRSDHASRNDLALSAWIGFDR